MARDIFSRTVYGLRACPPREHRGGRWIRRPRDDRRVRRRALPGQDRNRPDADRGHDARVSRPLARDCNPGGAGRGHPERCACDRHRRISSFRPDRPRPDAHRKQPGLRDGGAGHRRGEGRIMFRHVAINAMPPLLVQGALSMAGAVLIEASLGYLGLGTEPPQPSLGNLINGARAYMDHWNYFALRARRWLFLAGLTWPTPRTKHSTRTGDGGSDGNAQPCGAARPARRRPHREPPPGGRPRCHGLRRRPP